MNNKMMLSTLEGDAPQTLGFSFSPVDVITGGLSTQLRLAEHLPYVGDDVKKLNDATIGKADKKLKEYIRKIVLPASRNYLKAKGSATVKNSLRAASAAIAAEISPIVLAYSTATFSPAVGAVVTVGAYTAIYNAAYEILQELLKEAAKGAIKGLQPTMSTSENVRTAGTAEAKALADKQKRAAVAYASNIKNIDRNIRTQRQKQGALDKLTAANRQLKNQLAAIKYSKNVQAINANISTQTRNQGLASKLAADIQRLKSAVAIEKNAANTAANVFNQSHKENVGHDLNSFVDAEEKGNSTIMFAAAAAVAALFLG